MRSSKRFRARVLPAIGGGILAVTVVVFFLAGEREREDLRTFRELSTEYLNPRFADNVVNYWSLGDPSSYRHRLVQEYFLARSNALNEAPIVESVDVVLRFERQLMINWLERQILLRAAMLVEAEESEPGDGRTAWDTAPLDEASVQERIEVEYRDSYISWRDAALEGRRLPGGARERDSR